MKTMITFISILISTIALAWGFNPGGGGQPGGGGGQQPGGGGNQPDNPGGGGGASNAFTFDTFLTDSAIVDGCIIYGDLMTGYVADQTTITIPSNVTQIVDGALSGNAAVVTIDATAATNLTVIPESFASGCSNLVEVLAPTTVNAIENSAFTMDSALIAFVGDGVTTIGDYAFFGCSSLVLLASTDYETIGEAALTGVSYSTEDGDVYASEAAPLVMWIKADGVVVKSLTSTPSDYNTATLKAWLTDDVANLEAYLYSEEIATNSNFTALSVSGTNFLFTAQDVATLSVANAALQVSNDLVNWTTISKNDIIDGVYAMPDSVNGFARITYSLTW